MDQSGIKCEEVRSQEQLEVVLKAPSAYGIKTDQESVTYLNRGNAEIKTASTKPFQLHGVISEPVGNATFIPME